jgi:hypothetical protein
MTTIDASTQPDAPGTLDVSGALAIPSALAAARRALAQASAEYLAVLDSMLERPWTWHERELDVRYGVYRGAETIEAATAEIDGLLGGQAARGQAARIISMATIARWALQGRLASLDDAILDPVARDGEWTVRQVLGHTIDGQRSYGWVTRWRLSLPDGTGPIKMSPEVEAAAEAALPGEEAEAAGTLAELRARLDACLDEWALRLGSTPDAKLAKPALWSNTPVDIAFRLGRWSSHIAEHTVQLDKTLDWLGHQPTEVARIVRDLHTAWGRLESRLFPAATTSPEIDAILARVADTLVTEARSARAAV